MFVISNTVAVLRIFHVLLPFWFLLCFFTSPHNLMMVHVRFFGWIGALSLVIHSGELASKITSAAQGGLFLSHLLSAFGQEKPRLI